MINKLVDNVILNISVKRIKFYYNSERELDISSKALNFAVWKDGKMPILEAYIKKNFD